MEQETVTCFRLSSLSRAALPLAVFIIPPGMMPGSAHAQDAAPAAQAVPAKKNTFGIWRETLPSGLRLILQTRRDARLAAIDLRVRVGSGDETVATNGTAHLIEHLVFKGSESRKPGDFDRAMETIGGEISARTTRDSTQYATVVPGPKWREATGLLAELIQNPAFRAGDLDRERAVIRAEMGVAQSDTARLGYTEISQVAFGETEGYHLPLMGTWGDISRRSVEDIRAFWQTWYRPSNMTLCLTGDITINDARRLAEALFPGPPDVPSRQVAPRISAQASLGRVVRGTALPPTAQTQRGLTTLVMAFRAPSAMDTQTLVLLDALMPLLSDGQSGRLYQALRVKNHLAHAVTADVLPGRQGSLILVRVTTSPDKAARAEQATLEEIKRIREDGFSENDVADAQAIARGGVLYDLGTVEGAASRLATWDTLNPTLTPESYLSRVEAIKREDLQRTLARFLNPQEYAVTVIGAAAPAATPGSGEAR